MRRTSLSSVALAGIAFVVLYVILGVTLWLSFVATGAVAVIGAGSGLLIPGGPDTRAVTNGNPGASNLDVVALRIRFLFAVALTVTGGFLAGEVFAFAPVTAVAIGLAIGIGTIALPFVLSPTFRRRQSNHGVAPSSGMRLAAWGALATLTVVDGIWETIQTAVFSAGTGKWLTFADGLAMVGMGLLALILHELSTECVVHAIEIVETADGNDQYASRNTTDGHRVAVH